MMRGERLSPTDHGIFNRLGALSTVFTVSPPRKFYFLDREASVGDPAETFLTAPNIPLLTVANKIRKKCRKVPIND